jgi:hypothetical protein
MGLRTRGEVIGDVISMQSASATTALQNLSNVFSGSRPVPLSCEVVSP